MLVRSTAPCFEEPGRYKVWTHVVQSGRPRFLQISLEGEAAAIESELGLSTPESPRPLFRNAFDIAQAHTPEGCPEVSPEQVVTFALIRQCEVLPGEAHRDGFRAVARNERAGGYRSEAAARYVHVTPREQRLIRPMLLRSLDVVLEDPVNNGCDLSIPVAWGSVVCPAVWAPITETENNSRRITPVVVQGGAPVKDIRDATFVVVHHRREKIAASELGQPIEQVYPLWAT
jgi:hypothetical protein